MTVIIFQHSARSRQAGGGAGYSRFSIERHASQPLEARFPCTAAGAEPMGEGMIWADVRTAGELPLTKQLVASSYAAHCIMAPLV